MQWVVTLISTAFQQSCVLQTVVMVRESGSSAMICPCLVMQSRWSAYAMCCAYWMGQRRAVVRRVGVIEREWGPVSMSRRVYSRGATCTMETMFSEGRLRVLLSSRDTTSMSDQYSMQLLVGCMNTRMNESEVEGSSSMVGTGRAQREVVYHVQVVVVLEYTPIVVVVDDATQVIMSDCEESIWSVQLVQVGMAILCMDDVLWAVWGSMVQQKREDQVRRDRQCVVLRMVDLKEEMWGKEYCYWVQVDQGVMQLNVLLGERRQEAF